MNYQNNDSINEQAWQLIEKLASASLEEQKKARRWSLLFKLLTFVYITVVLIGLWPALSGFNGVEAGDDHLAVVTIKGMIADDQPASANAIVSGLREAFEAEHSKAVVLSINSPGGSPVQSAYVYKEIKRLRGLHPDKPIYAVIADLGASGAYYIAAATDDIYASPASLVGSIGVISAGFGFTELIGKIGVERRTFTSGDNKAFLDPFSPLKKEEQDFWNKVLTITHQQFIAAVKEGRGDRLKDNDALFSGLIWSGEQALDLGLIDGYASAGELARKILNNDNIVDYTTRQDPVTRLLRKISSQVSATLVELSLSQRLAY